MIKIQSGKERFAHDQKLFSSFIYGVIFSFSVLNFLFNGFYKKSFPVAVDWTIVAPRRFVWKPTATIGGGRSAVWACGQVAERLVHMPMRPCSA